MSQPPNEADRQATGPGTGHRGVPAGQVLIAGLLGLAVAALLNAGQLLRDAERKPLGTERDVSVAVWEPVEALSSTLQLTKPREWADSALGREHDDELFELPTADDESGDVTIAASPASTTLPETTAGISQPLATTTVAPTTAPPTTTTPPGPTAENPLRMWVVGDSMVNYFGDTLAGIANTTGVVDADAESLLSSGLTRPDFFDWPARLNEIVTSDDPDLMVVMFGGNDAQGIITPDGAAQPFGEAWVTEYSGRVGGVMDLLVGDDERWVVWVGQPIMDSDSFDAKMIELNKIYAAQADLRERVIFVPTRDLFRGEGGGYSRFITMDDGTVLDARLADGIHLSTAGGRWLSQHILEQIETLVDLSGGPGSTG